jgi:hypothetical protein
MNSDEWRKEKEKKRQERDMARFQLRMSTPAARGEVYQLGETQFQHIASLALAIEALEDIFIARGVLKPDELLAKMKALAEKKAEQAATADLIEKEN